MDGLFLHCGANLVDRQQVIDTPTPGPTGTHFPIPHALLLAEAERNLAASGFRVAKEAHALTKGGNRYFGMLQVYLADPSAPADHALLVGLRNTHDYSWAAALAIGSYVFVCDNLGFSGEVLLGRKHTRHIARDIPLLMPRAFAALSAERVTMESRIAAYKQRELGDKEAHDFLIRASVDEKLWPLQGVPRVLKLWRDPPHQEFKERTAWSLFNAFTEAAKPETEADANLQRLVGRTKGLHGFFDKQLGLSLPSREEILARGCDAGGLEDVVVGAAVRDVVKV